MFLLIKSSSCTLLMAASAQVNSRMQLNLLAFGWFVVVCGAGMAWIAIGLRSDLDIDADR
jgi:hypothetical protein